VKKVRYALGAVTLAPAVGLPAAGGTLRETGPQRRGPMCRTADRGATGRAARDRAR